MTDVRKRASQPANPYIDEMIMGLWKSRGKEGMLFCLFCTENEGDGYESLRRRRENSIRKNITHTNERERESKMVRVSSHIANDELPRRRRKNQFRHCNKHLLCYNMQLIDFQSES